MQPQDIPAFASFLSDRAAALRGTIKGPFHTFFFLIFILRNKGLGWKTFSLSALILFPAGVQNFCISIKDKEETCTTLKQSEEKEDFCVHAR